MQCKYKKLCPLRFQSYPLGTIGWWAICWTSLFHGVLLVLLGFHSQTQTHAYDMRYKCTIKSLTMAERFIQSLYFTCMNTVMLETHKYSLLTTNQTRNSTADTLSQVTVAYIDLPGDPQRFNTFQCCLYLNYLLKKISVCLTVSCCRPASSRQRREQRGKTFECVNLLN